MLSGCKSYALLRVVDHLQDPSLSLRSDAKLELIREKAHENFRKGYTRYAATYCLRLRPVTYHVKQTIFRRNFTESRLADHYNSKHANQFDKAVVIARYGLSNYELNNLKAKKLGIFHAKDLRA